MAEQHDEPAVYKQLSTEMRQGLKDIYQQISTASSDQATPVPDTDALFHEASDQLGEVLKATETATMSIMEIVEKHLDLQAESAELLAAVREGAATESQKLRLSEINNQLGDINSVKSNFTDIKECYVSNTGYTRLFKARRFGKTYMLKCLKKDYLFTPMYRMALNKEFEIGLQFEHTNICRTIGMEELDKLGPVIILEYIDGETLESCMSKGLLTQPLARKFFAQIKDVLQYIHNKQTIHRDLKPSNIMVTHNGLNIKLIDFSLSDNDTFNIFKSPGGTSGYIAPELFLPNAKSDIRCDIYSFGVLASYMAEITHDKMMMQIARQCINHNPEQRPESMAEISIPTEGNSLQIAALVFLSLSALCLLAYIIIRLTQVF